MQSILTGYSSVYPPHLFDGSNLDWTPARINTKGRRGWKHDTTYRCRLSCKYKWVNVPCFSGVISTCSRTVGWMCQRAPVNGVTLICCCCYGVLSNQMHTWGLLETGVCMSNSSISLPQDILLRMLKGKWSIEVSSEGECFTVPRELVCLDLIWTGWIHNNIIKTQQLFNRKLFI